MKLWVMAFGFLSLMFVVFATAQNFAKVPEGQCIAVIYDNQRFLSEISKHMELVTGFNKIYVSMGDYQEGQIERCQASFILNGEFDNPVPKKIVSDYLKSQKNVVWMGYNIWSLGDRLDKQLGLRYMGSYSKKSESCALFYRGRNTHCSEPGLSLQPEMVPTNEQRVSILAEARIHGNELFPYLIRAKNLFYMADVNFGSVFQEFLPEFVGHRTSGPG